MIGACKFFEAGEERRLARRMRRGDRHAQDALARSVQPLLLRIAVSFQRAALRRGMDLDDLLAEANLALSRVLRVFDPRRGRLTTVAAVAVKRHLLDVVSPKPSRIPAHGLPDGFDLAGGDGAEHPVNLAILEERAARVHEALAELRPEERTILIQRYGEDRLWREIAADQGRSTSGVQLKAARCLKRLQERLSEMAE